MIRVDERRSYFTAGQARPYDGSGVSAVLPSPSALLCALRGQCGTDALTELVNKLAGVHQELVMHPDRADRLRMRAAGLIGEIDAWTMRNLPSPAVGARRNPFTLGETVDRIAAVAARAFELLMTDDPSGVRLHAQWTQLAELEVAYGDLVRDLRDGRRYLPTIRLCGADARGGINTHAEGRGVQGIV